MSKYKVIEDFLSLHTCTEVTDFAITEGKWSFKSKGSIHDYVVEQVIKGISVFEFSVCGNEDKFNSSFSDYVYQQVEYELNRINEASVLTKVSKELIDFESSCSDIKGYLKVIEEDKMDSVTLKINLDTSSLKKDIQEAREMIMGINSGEHPSNFQGTQFNSEPLMKYDPTNGVQCPYPSNPRDYREYHGKVAWLYNPYTGGTRTVEDVGSDVFGYLIEPQNSTESKSVNNYLSELLGVKVISSETKRTRLASNSTVESGHFITELTFWTKSRLDFTEDYKYGSIVLTSGRYNPENNSFVYTADCFQGKETEELMKCLCD